MTHLPPVSVISIGVSFATIHTLPVHCSTLQRRTNLGTGRRTKNRLFEVYKKPLPRHQSSSYRITGKPLHSLRMQATLQLVLSLNKKTLTEDLTQSLTTLSLYNRRSAIMRSTIKNYLPLSTLLSTSDTTSKETHTLRRFLLITRLFDPSLPNNPLHADKHAGPYFWPLSTTSLSQSRARLTKPMLCPGVQIIKRG